MRYAITDHAIQRRPSSKKYPTGFLISFLKKADSRFELQNKPNGHYKIWAKGGKTAIVVKKTNRLVLITFRRLKGNEDMQIRLISEEEMKMKAEKKAQNQTSSGMGTSESVLAHLRTLSSPENMESAVSTNAEEMFEIFKEVHGEQIEKFEASKDALDYYSSDLCQRKYESMTKTREFIEETKNLLPRREIKMT